MKTKWFFGALAMLVATSVSSCKKEPGERPVVFPDLTNVPVTADTRAAFEFDATHDWELKVLDSEWLHFVADDNATTGTADTLGVAGHVSMRYYVSEEGLEDFTESSTEVELTMRGTSKIVFKVTRAPRIEGAAMFTWENNTAVAIDALEFVFNNQSRSVPTVRVGFAAKYDWEVASVPEGVSYGTEAFTGSQYAKPAATADFKIFTLDAAKIARALPADAKIVIRNRQNTSETVEFPVTYAGITDGNVMVISPMNMTTQGRNFSKEGYLLQPGIGEPYGDNRKTDVATVICKDMDYTLAVVEYKLVGESITAKELTGEDNWITATDDENGSITIGVKENTGDAREAYLLILPPAKAADAKLNDGEWVGAIVSARGGIKISQKVGKVSTGGFFVGWGSMHTPATEGSVSQDFSLLGGNPPSSNEMPEDPSKIWIYTYSNADINNKPVIAPLGFPEQSAWEWVKLRPTPMGIPSFHSSVTVESATTYPGGMGSGQPTVPGVRLTGIAPVSGTNATLVLFYKEDYRTSDGEGGFIDLYNKRADAALLMVQTP